MTQHVQDGLNAMIDQLELRMVDETVSSGLRHLRMVLAWMVRGELGMRLELWRTGKNATRLSVRMEKHAAQVCSVLEHHMADRSKRSSIRLLRLILVQLMRGELGMRLELWRTAKGEAEWRLMQVHHSDMVEELALRMKSQAKASCIRLVRLIIIRIMRGEMGMRLEIWRMGKSGARQSCNAGVLDEIASGLQQVEARLNQHTRSHDSLLKTADQLQRSHQKVGQRIAAMDPAWQAILWQQTGGLEEMEASLHLYNQRHEAALDSFAEYMIHASAEAGKEAAREAMQLVAADTREQLTHRDQALTDAQAELALLRQNLVRKVTNIAKVVVTHG
eukprot:TRINITY_DN60310_c0_g1_i1.p1 TRINITY_DN60310_c0_g1~~TRINITY_DN60310_c0_g1_i1.p1  ORF type:complete len:333 (+),score=76.94 TRINITY_DN60310_c0_g1_i1:193-1191(+)